MFKLSSRLILLAFLLLIPGIRVVSQSKSAADIRDYKEHPAWVEMMQDPNANFFEVRRAFYTYWQGRPTHRGDGYKPFRRWENFWQYRVNPDGTFPESGYVAKEFNRFAREHPGDGGLKTGSRPWVEMGPKTRVDYGGYTGLGRLNAIACDPADTSIVYVCAPSGGLWKTTDGGRNWRPMTDELPTLGASAILIHPARKNEILLGTGDRDHGDARGLGVIRSTDGGESWEFYNTGMGEVTVGMFARSDTDPNLILAATSQGVFKTLDGGGTWAKKTEGNINFKDIKLKPGTHTTSYASAVNPPGFWRSENAGESWTQVPDSAGAPVVGRIVIAVTPAASNLVYLVCGAGAYEGCFVSQDDGKTFIKQSSTPNILGYAQDGSDNSSQAWYDLCIHADPINAQVLHVGGINLWRSDNGGRNWRITGHWTGSGAMEVHADQHTFFYNPVNKRLYAGNDGGIYYSDNQGMKWTEITEGLGIGQIYRLGVSQTNPHKVITGFQDNGSATWTGTEWWTVGGGDGMECAIDPTDYQYSYSTLYYGAIDQLLFNDFQRRVGGEGIGGINESGAWVTPFIIHEEDGNTMIAGYRNVWITHDLKNPTRISWKKISNNLAGTNDPYMTALEQSPADLNLLFASRSDRHLFRTDNFNPSTPVWIDLTSGLPSQNTPTDIECHPYDPMTVYITLGRKVYKSTDKGETWTDISGSLPSIPMNTIAFDKSSLEGLYVGTDAGAYFRDAGMSDWVFFNSGLPNSVEISDLEIYYDHLDRTKSKLSASTFGRGLWETGLAESQPILPATALTAIPGNGAINLYWNAPFYPQYVTSYRIFRNSQYYGTTTSPFYSDDQAELNKDYSYHIVAVYFNNTDSDASNRAAAILLDPVTLPYYADFTSSSFGWTGNKPINGWTYGNSFDLEIQGNTGNFYGIVSSTAAPGTRITGSLTSPAIDLTSHQGSQLTLRFSSAFRKIAGSEQFTLAYRINPDSSWTSLTEFGEGDPANWSWSQTTQVLPPEALSAKTQFGFLYDNNSEPGGGAAVDDIEIFVSVVGIPEILKPNGMRIYPNPSSGNFSVEFEQSLPGDIMIRILSLSGQVVSEKRLSNYSGQVSEPFSLSREPKGIYVINIRSANREWNEKITIR
ncbi:MAG: hypothetical protein A2X22_00720 [Bacteroidetes bacterium GWF2_49_14]|nr:MAG: hypothetical protein A2X22_00720 [Bacteroidetes bacterium GWF2_49_14]